MWIMFEATFRLGEYPMEWIESFVGWIGEFVRGNMSEGPLKDLLVDGIIGGVGGVIVFLPNLIHKRGQSVYSGITTTYKGDCFALKCLFKAQVTSFFFLTHWSGQKLFCLEFFSKQLYIQDI